MKIVEWIDERIISQRKTAIVGGILLLGIDRLLWERIPCAISYVLYVIAGLLCLASVLRCWKDKKKLQIALSLLYAFLILFCVGGIIREMQERPKAVPARETQQYVGVESGQQQAESRQASGTQMIELPNWTTDAAKTCPICNGRKTCNLCGGLKRCQFSYGSHPCMNGKLYLPDMTLTCSSCNGTSVCRECGGTGKCTWCDGAGVK